MEALPLPKKSTSSRPQCNRDADKTYRNKPEVKAKRQEYEKEYRKANAAKINARKKELEIEKRYAHAEEWIVKTMTNEKLFSLLQKREEYRAKQTEESK
tara:strand:+ start:779 stop:1075 length:297 start_codon:yes stop_codon:yes gene_type:complete